MKYNNENLKNITAIYLQTQIVIASHVLNTVHVQMDTYTCFTIIVANQFHKLHNIIRSLR